MQTEIQQNCSQNTTGELRRQQEINTTETQELSQ